MVARDFQALTRRRAKRARELSARFAASREVLEFLARVADFQVTVDPDAPLESLPALVGLAQAYGPPALAARAGEDHPFFERSLLQPARFGDTACEHVAQAGLLEPLAHGKALRLCCAFCLFEWDYPRNRCIACGQTDTRRLAYYGAEQIPHIQVMTCDECRQYVHLLDKEKEPGAIADIDELVALPLDLWASERGFTKLQPNLAGI